MFIQAMLNMLNLHMMTKRFVIRFLFLIYFVGGISFVIKANEVDIESDKLKISVFDIDATPPVGTFMAYNPMVNSWDLGLRARGIVLIGSGEPVVLCAVDWIGIANDSHEDFRKALADAAGTTKERVALHTLHQHDAPRSDFGAERILKEANLDPGGYEGSFDRILMGKLAEAVKNSLNETVAVTHIGLGSAEVYQVASNRRIFGPDGRVCAARYSACGDPKLRAEPEGLIDPIVSLISFWNNEKPVAVLSFYATHPQSYYRTGIANPDFPGIARFMRQLEIPDALHIHFNGAGGNIGAGKYNDGSKVNRGILAQRLADGMKRAWEATKKEKINRSSVEWLTIPVSLPPSANSMKNINDWGKTGDSQYLPKIVPNVAYVERYRQGKQIDVTCLKAGRARIIGLPGEPFVEYQLFAKAECPDLFVAVAAYGDYGPGYIPVAEAYEQGGYEVEAAGVAPEADEILKKAIQSLLHR